MATVKNSFPWSFAITERYIFMVIPKYSEIKAEIYTISLSKTPESSGRLAYITLNGVKHYLIFVFLKAERKTALPHNLALAHFLFS